MRPLAGLILAGIMASAGADASQLHSGAAHSLQIAPQPEEALVQDLTFPVIPGTPRLTIEVETDDPSHDLDLFVRFARPVVENYGVISTGFSSATPGRGVEKIEIDAGSAPLLQTGVYYIALNVKTLDTEITAGSPLPRKRAAPRRRSSSRRSTISMTRVGLETIPSPP